MHGFWKATQSACPNKGCAAMVTHDAEEQAQPCSDGCWLQMGLRELLAERGAALTESEAHELLQGALDELGGHEHEHPASVALCDLGEAYDTKIRKYLSGGDRNAALILSGVRGDLEHVRGML